MGVNQLTIVQNKLQSLIDGRMERFVERAVDDEYLLILDLNKLQLSLGIDSNGRAIKPPYRPATIKIKQAKGQPVDKVTLLDTGRWQDHMEVEKYKGKLSIFSSDPKEPLLQEKYGEDIEGLTQGSLEIVSEEILPSVNDQTRKFLNL